MILASEDLSTVAKIHQRKGQRYAAKTSTQVHIETQSFQVLRGQLVDESKGGIGVVIDGERPGLAPKQRVRIRCRAGYGNGEVRYIKEESSKSYRVGIKWKG